MYKINRFYLIFALLFSLTAPLYKIDLPISTQETNISPELLAFIMQNPELFQQEEGINLGNIISFIVVIIGVFLLIKFIYNLFELLFKIKTDEKIQDKEVTYILDLESNQPYSFWNYIFIPKKQLNQLHQNLIDHEKAHCIQKHSFDIIIIEIFQILFWFNPFIYFYKKSIKLNHEFLADEYVLQKETDVKTYQHQILDCIATQSSSSMASHFNFILTKKRLIMMTKNTSKRKVKLLSFASLPFILSAFVLFSQKSFAQEVEKSAKKVEQTLDKTVKSQADEIFGSKNESSKNDTITKIVNFQENITKDSIKNLEKSISKNNDITSLKVDHDTVKYKVISNFTQTNNNGISIKKIKTNDLLTDELKTDLAKLNPKDIKSIHIIREDKKMIIKMNDSVTYSYNVDDKKLIPLNKSDLLLLKKSFPKINNSNKDFKFSIDPKKVIQKDGYSIYIDDKGAEHKINTNKIETVYLSKSNNNNISGNGKKIGSTNTFSYTFSSNDNQSIDDRIKDLKQKEISTRKQIKELEKLKKEQKK